MGTIIVSILLIAIVAGIIFSMIKRKHAGGHPSCGCSCSACGGACSSCSKNHS